MIPKATFEALARQGYNRIPLSREVIADLDTPLSAYLKLVDGPYAYLLESVQGGEKWGRYSIIGLPAQQILRVTQGVVTVHVDGVETNLGLHAALAADAEFAAGGVDTAFLGRFLAARA